METTSEPKVSLREPANVLDDFGPYQEIISNDNNVDSDDEEMPPLIDDTSVPAPTVTAPLKPFIPQHLLERMKLTKPYSTNIKTGQTDGVKKTYEAKNVDVGINICPECAKKQKAELYIPTFTLVVGEVYMSITGIADDQFAIHYYSVKTGQSFQQKTMSAKKLRKNLADIVFGRPAPIKVQLAIRRGTLGLRTIEDIDKMTLQRELKYFLAFL